MDAPIREIQDRLYGFILYKTRHEEDSKDILQDVLLKVYTNVHKLKCDKSFIPWVYAITRNTINDYFKDRRKELPSGVDLENGQAEEQPENCTTRFACCLMPIIDSLPEKYRDAVYLVDIEGWSQKELAEKLGISYSGLKSRVQRGREKLREMLTRCCMVETDVYGNILSYKKNNS